MILIQRKDFNYESNIFRFKNKRVFISGGGSGIGATIVEYFCEQKSEVFFIDIDLKSSNKLIKNIKDK